MITSATGMQSLPYLILTPETPGGVGLIYRCTDHNGGAAGSIYLERREEGRDVWAYWPATANPTQTDPCDSGYRELRPGGTLQTAILRMARMEAWNRAKMAAALGRKSQ